MRKRITRYARIAVGAAFLAMPLASVATAQDVGRTTDMERDDGMDFGWIGLLGLAGLLGLRGRARDAYSSTATSSARPA
jgi:hypothetical protein